MQWNELGLKQHYSGKKWLNFIQEAYTSFQSNSASWNTESFQKQLIQVLLNNLPSFNPTYYDVWKFYSPHLQSLQYVTNLSEPKSILEKEYFIEQPPFIFPKPRRRATKEDIRTKPWLLKSSIDAFRLPLLRQLFPNADFKIIHLTRSPEASINGLYEGWRYSKGFFSHNLKQTSNFKIEIEGYSDYLNIFSECFWNFELFPQWQEFLESYQSGKKLEYICGQQWYSCHKAILDSIKNLGLENNTLTIRFEDILPSSSKLESRQKIIGKILDFIGIEFDKNLMSAFQTMQDSPVMSVNQPNENRWQKRKDLIEPVSQQLHIMSLKKDLLQKVWRGTTIY